MKTIETKVAESFELEFGYKAEKITIEEGTANADGYWCKITSKGVKKNSWRLINF